MTPDAVLPAEGGGERLELLLLLPVPAAGAAARDHGAVRLLPRGGRRGRRDERDAGGRREARVVARRAGESRARRCAASGHASPAGAQGQVRDLGAAPERDHRRHGDGPHADALSRLAGARALLLSRRRRGRPARRRDLRLRQPAHARLREGPGHRLPAHQHHPRRRRGRAQESHLPADGRAQALRGPGGGHPQRAPDAAVRRS